MFKKILVFLVTTQLTTCALKYNMIAPEEIVTGGEEVYFNGIKIPKTLYVSPKVFVVGVLLHEEKPGDNIRPVDTNYMFVDKEVDIRAKDFRKKYTGAKTSAALGFPTFEVEVGREPLEFLIHTFKTKYGVDAWPTNNVGIGNQYGYGYLDPKQFPDEPYFGSSVTHMNPNSSPDLIEQGCYLGSFMGTTPSKPDFSRFEKAPNQMLTMTWQMYQAASKPVPVIYIGYTIATNFNKIDPFFMNEAKPFFHARSVIQYSKSIGLNSATQGASPSGAFLRMALMLDNLADGVVAKTNGLKEKMLVEDMRSKKQEGNISRVQRSEMERIRI